MLKKLITSLLCYFVPLASLYPPSNSKRKLSVILYLPPPPLFFMHSIYIPLPDDCFYTVKPFPNVNLVCYAGDARQRRRIVSWALLVAFFFDTKKVWISCLLEMCRNYRTRRKWFILFELHPAPTAPPLFTMYSGNTGLKTAKFINSTTKECVAHMIIWRRANPERSAVKAASSFF